MSSKRRRAAEGAVAGSTKQPIRQEYVLAILLSLIECGRAAPARYNNEGEAIQTATASPSTQLSLPWTGTGNAMSIPQGQTVMFLTRDPTCPLMYYDYNNGGTAGAAQVGNYTWQAGPSNATFTCPNGIATQFRPAWAVNTPIANSKAFHGGLLFAKYYGDRTYVHCDAPPSNASAAVSSLTIQVAAGTQVATETVKVVLYRLAGGADSFIGQFTFTFTGSGAATVGTFTVPFTDAYRIEAFYTGAAGSQFILLSCTQNWACGTLCHVALPQIATIWQQLNRIRILGANLDVINQTPASFRGGSVLDTQLPAGTSEYQALQGQQDPYTYVSNVRGSEPKDMAKGRYVVLKPDGETAFKWQTPFVYDGTLNVTYTRMPAKQESGFVMIAINAPDLVPPTGGVVQTVRGQVTLDMRFSIEIDSEFDWFDFRSSMFSTEEWDRAEEIMAHMDLSFDDPDWGKIWAYIKKGLAVGSKILTLVPDPRAQAIGRGTNTILDVLG